jgi:hypothetical protein
MLLISGVLGLIVLGSIAQVCNNSQLAAVAVGALAGLIGGHLNGTESKKEAK